MIFQKNAEVGDIRTISAFHFRYAHCPVTAKTCAVVAYPSTTTSHCVRMCNVFIICQFFYFCSAGIGPYAERCTHPASSAKYFKLMQFFTRDRVYTLNFGLIIRIFLRFAPTLLKPFISHTLFRKSMSDLGFILSKSILL